MSLVLAVTATYGRHYHVERSLAMFLRQDYGNKHLVIYQNCIDKPQILAPGVPNNVTLLNESSRSFDNLGELYTHLFETIEAQGILKEKPDYVIFWDDDDIYLPNHISTRVDCVKRLDKLAYYPVPCFSRQGDKFYYDENACRMEPNWIVSYDVVRSAGFRFSTQGDHHLAWIDYLKATSTVVADEKGQPTFAYTWSNPDEPVFKYSGNFMNPDNMRNYKAASKSHGDGIITPLDNAIVDKLYHELSQVKVK